MELKEQELLDLIKTGKRIVLKVHTTAFMCPHCVKYKPIFEAEAKLHSNSVFASLDLNSLAKGGSQFKSLYMKLSSQKEKADVPATIIFEKGEMVARKWGILEAEQLKEFLASNVIDDPKPNYNAEIMDLFAQKGRIITICEEHQKVIDANAAQLGPINTRIQELNKLLLEGK